jgi:hypothetical protein
MNRLAGFLSLFLLVTPIFAQDDAGNSGGLSDGGLFGVGAANAAGNRGGQQGTVDRLASLRALLLNANAPLQKGQEKGLNAMLDKEIKAMSDALRAKFPQETAPVAAPRGGQPQGQRGAAPRGARGAAAAAVDTPYTAEIRRMNTELLAKVITALQPQQQIVVKKWMNDQVRARGGLDALSLTMEEAGTPLTSEQLPPLQALYSELNQSRTQALREAQGKPDPAKLNELEIATMSKVLKLLNDNQRKALLQSMAKPQQ